MESFSSINKRNYTFGVRHSFPALFDLMLEHILVGVSLDVETQRKCYEKRCKPDIFIYRRARNILPETYNIDQFNEGNLMYKKVENIDSYEVDFLSDACTYRYFLKHACCKHILYAHKEK
jgi:hypothetical protein